MRYELKNLGPGAFYCVEVAKLVKPGEAVRVNQVDEGTRRLTEGPKPRLALLNLEEDAPPRPPESKKLQSILDAVPVSTASAPNADPSATSPSATAPANGKGKESPKPARGAAPDSADVIK